MILILGGHPLSFIILEAITSILSHIISYLRLVFIALDHLLKMLFHGKLARAAGQIWHVLLLLLIYNHRFEVLRGDPILVLHIILQLSLVKSIG
jgi:hypothetical protein